MFLQTYSLNTSASNMSVFEKFTRALEVPHPPNEIRATALVSHDVKPIEIARRTWGEYTLFAYIHSSKEYFF